MSNAQKVLIGVLGVCILFFGFVIGRIGGADIHGTVLTTGEVQPIPADKIYDPAAWGELYPLEYASYLKMAEMELSPGGIFGGSINSPHSERQPEIQENFKGYAFSVEYTEDRGHVYAMADIKETKRVTDKTRGACITCKTPYIEYFYEEYGWDYAAMPFTEIFDQVPFDHGSISCANCHDPNTMELRVVNPAFIEAQARRGVDLSQANLNDMRSYVCGQCHAEYYFEPETYKVIFPWDNGFRADDIYEYYADIPNGFTGDWLHPDSQVMMLKGQHPDFETWSLGVHGKSGVSCADCHMPYMLEDGRKYSSHWLTSPLRNIEASCGVCHDQGSEWLLDSVVTIQENFWQLQHSAGTAVAEAHEAILRASQAEGVDEDELANARELVRKAQWFWDYIAAENGMGFHNPDQGMNSTGQALEYANQAILSAYKAAHLELPANSN